jgi:hypothetical protein
MNLRQRLLHCCMLVYTLSCIIPRSDNWKIKNTSTDKPAHGLKNKIVCCLPTNPQKCFVVYIFKKSINIISIMFLFYTGI